MGETHSYHILTRNNSDIKPRIAPLSPDEIRIWKSRDLRAKFFEPKLAIDPITVALYVTDTFDVTYEAPRGHHHDIRYITTATLEFPVGSLRIEIPKKVVGCTSIGLLLARGVIPEPYASREALLLVICSLTKTSRAQLAKLKMNP